MRKALVLLAAWVLGIGLALTGAPAANAVGNSGLRCVANAGYDWKVCVQVHTYVSGNGYLTNSASVYAYHQGIYYHGFKNTYNGYVSFTGSGGNNLGQWNLPNVTPGNWDLVITNVHSGGGACYTMAGKVNLSTFDDQTWVITGNILGGPC